MTKNTHGTNIMCKYIFFLQFYASEFVKSANHLN